MKKGLVSTLTCLAVLIAACVSASDNGRDNNDDISIFEEKKQTYINMTLNANSKNSYTELVRLVSDVTPDEGVLRGDQGLQMLQNRLDTADFRLPGLLHILIQYSDSDLLSDSFKSDARNTLLGFKYWPDELGGWDWDYPAGTDSLEIYAMATSGVPAYEALAAEAQASFDSVDAMDDMCYWSENHYILFSAGAYLAAQLYPDAVFDASGQTGTERMALYKDRIMQWLELRYKSGFSEWLSNVYYNEDIPALVSLIELCEDDEISKLATMVLDLMMADMALNHFRGAFASTHGRSYENHKMSAYKDSTDSLFRLMFGFNTFGVGNMSATLLALSEKYQLPKVIYEMANDIDRQETINKQRMGIHIEQAANWGLSVDDPNDAMTFLTMEAYAHPDFVTMFKRMLDDYYLWGNSFFQPFKEARLLLEHPVEATGGAAGNLWELANAVQRDLTRNMRSEVNIYTYRTPDYMLSTAQDWRAGYGGDQQSIWQASLGMEATCFTTHPGSGKRSGDTPNYWTGYGTLPRAIQVENVVITLYDVDTSTEYYVTGQPEYTHAYLPRGKFDETSRQEVTDGVWFFAREGNGYLALYSSDARSDWLVNDVTGDAAKGDYDIRSDGEKTIWIAELGRQGNDYTGFNAFQTAILTASLIANENTLEVTYDSPSQGMLAMGWTGALTQDDVLVDVNDYRRYDNPYSSSDFPGSHISFTCNEETLVLDFDSKTRTVSSFLK